MNKIVLSILTLSMLVLASCSNFLDINEDPNNPREATLSFVLPSVQVNMAGALGAATGGLGNFTSLYIHHTVQRGTQQNDYAFQGDDFGVSTPWRLLNTFALNDLEQMLVQAEELQAGPYLGVGKIMKAYMYSIMVDMWGDVPFSEAQQGAENLFPKFDDGQQVYNSVFALLDEGIADLAAESSFAPGSDDLIYGGDLDKWRKFANTLKLKMYTQVRLAQDVSAEVAKLISEDGLIGPGDDFQMQYGTSSAPENRNLGYAQEYAAGGAFNYISPYFFEIMKGDNTFFDENIYKDIEDPRIPYYFYNQLPDGATDADAENPCSYCPSRSGTPFLSIWMFSFNIDPNEGFDQSSSQTVMGLYPIGGRYDDGQGGAVNFNGAADTPQRLLTYYARKYLEAELAITGVTDGDARALLEEAIRASFDKVDEIAAAASAPALVEEDVEAYIAAVLERYDAADAEGKLEHIMTQKWIATYGFGVDAYTDYRRTGYPKLHDPNTDNLNVTASARLYPLAFPYPQSELNRNPNAPGQRNITTDGVFWDK